MVFIVSGAGRSLSHQLSHAKEHARQSTEVAASPSTKRFSESQFKADPNRCGKHLIQHLLQISRAGSG